MPSTMQRQLVLLRDSSVSLVALGCLLFGNPTQLPGKYDWGGFYKPVWGEVLEHKAVTIKQSEFISGICHYCKQVDAQKRSCWAGKVLMQT